MEIQEKINTGTGIRIESDRSGENAMKISKKKMVIYGLLVLILTGGTAFSQTLALKANIGVCACWDAIGLNIYEMFGIKVGTFGMIMNIMCVLVQFFVRRKEFQLRKLLQVPYAVLFGVLVNFFNYDVLTFELDSYAMKVVFVILSYVGLSFFLGLLLLLNLIAMPSETMCNVISGKYEVDYAKVRISLDAVSILVSIALSLIAGLSFKVREGTVIGMLMLGSLEKVSMNIFRPYIEKIKNME